jgi:hypothetical protein
LLLWRRRVSIERRNEDMSNGNRMKALAALALAAMWLATSGVASAQATGKATHPAKAVSRVELPAPIKAAFEAAYPNATIKNVSTEKEGGETHYEVESMDGTLARDLIYRADGTVVEMEEALARTDLPQPVLDAAAHKYPNGKILKAERLTRGTTVSYELQIKVGKKTHQLVLDPAGAPVVAAKEAAENESEK